MWEYSDKSKIPTIQKTILFKYLIVVIIKVLLQFNLIVWFFLQWYHLTQNLVSYNVDVKCPKLPKSAWNFSHNSD